MAERARAADRHRRSAELKEIKELITFQEQRAAEGFRPTEADLKVKLSRQKGQRHSHSVAADVQKLERYNCTSLAELARACLDEKEDPDDVAVAEVVAVAVHR